MSDIVQLIDIESLGAFKDEYVDNTFAKKSEMKVTPGTGVNADKTTIQLKTGTSATVLTQHQDISDLIARIAVLENKVAYYHPEEVTIEASPNVVYEGISTTVNVTITTPIVASSIKLYKGNTLLKEVTNKNELIHEDTINPRSTSDIVYNAEAVINGETKNASTKVRVLADILNSVVWSGYSMSPSTVNIDSSATFDKGTVTAKYASGDKNVTLSALFSAEQGRINGNTYVAPSIAGSDTISASYGGITAADKLTVTIKGESVIDYYIGWTTGTPNNFNNKDVSEIIDGARGYSSAETPEYTRTFGNDNIFYLLYQENKVPTQVIFTSQGQSMTQDIIEDNTCPYTKEPIVINGVTYNEFGIGFGPGYDTTSSIKIKFN